MELRRYYTGSLPIARRISYIIQPSLRSNTRRLSSPELVLRKMLLFGTNLTYVIIWSTNITLIYVFRIRKIYSIPSQASRRLLRKFSAIPTKNVLQLSNLQTLNKLSRPLLIRLDLSNQRHDSYRKIRILQNIIIKDLKIKLRTKSLSRISQRILRRS